MKRNSGFTLVEILIVVIILGILAAIIIPQFTDASNEARTSSMNSNLQTLKSQMELYKVQHLDLYPFDQDDDGALDAVADIRTRLTTKTDETGAGGGNLGPYMQEVPLNPFADNDPAVIGDAAAPAGTEDWLVDLTTGAITPGVTP